MQRSLSYRHRVIAEDDLAFPIRELIEQVLGFSPGQGLPPAVVAAGCLHSIPAADPVAQPKQGLTQ
jgi:hypothetical protein